MFALAESPSLGDFFAAQHFVQSLQILDGPRVGDCNPCAAGYEPHHEAILVLVSVAKRDGDFGPVRCGEIFEVPKESPIPLGVDVDLIESML